MRAIEFKRHGSIFNVPHLNSTLVVPTDDLFEFRTVRHTTDGRRM